MRDQYQDQILGFAFKLSRKTPTELNKLASELDELIFAIRISIIASDDTNEIKMYMDDLILLYKMIAQTRDITNGKGERDLTYMMCYTWHNYFPLLALNAIQSLASDAYMGSWKDIKYMCEYIREHSPKSTEDEFIQQCVEILNQQFIQDIIDKSQNRPISFVSKWIPREKSPKFGWLYEKCVHQWSIQMHPEYFYPSQTHVQREKAINKCKREYRILLSQFNKWLDTPQIYECAQKWSEIDPIKISQHTLHKQYHALLNQDIYGYLRNQDKDRLSCRETFLKYQYPPNSSQNNTSSSFQMEDLVKIVEKGTNMEHLYSQWEKVKNAFPQKTEYIFPLLDLSTKNSLNAMAISLMLSEISKCPDKILAYDQTCDWISLSQTPLFLDKIYMLQQLKQTRGTETSNIYAVFDFIMEALKQTEMKPEEVKNIVFVVISDYSNKTEDLHDYIEKFFRKNGYDHLPQMVYWNVSMQHQTYIPCKYNTPRTLLLSGTSSSTFQFLKCPEWKNYTPYEYLCYTLDQDKYKYMEGVIHELLEPDI